MAVMPLLRSDPEKPSAGQALKVYRFSPVPAVEGSAALMQYCLPFRHAALQDL